MHNFSDQDTDRIIQMAWEDRTPFEAIEIQFGLPVHIERLVVIAKFRMVRKPQCPVAVHSGTGCVNEWNVMRTAVLPQVLRRADVELCKNRRIAFDCR